MKRLELGCVSFISTVLAFVIGLQVGAARVRAVYREQLRKANARTAEAMKARMHDTAKRHRL